MRNAYTAGQAARYSGVPYKTLDFWARTEFIVPSVLESTGKGTARIYSFRDLIALRTALKLRQAGISLQALRMVVARLEELDGLESPLAETYLASDGFDVFIKHGDEIRSVLRRPGQVAFTWVLDLSGIVQEVVARTAA